MRFRKAMMRALFIGGLALTSSAASAQDAQTADGESEAPLLVADTVDCRYQVRPDEVAICNAPVLAAMDIQMGTLFKVLNLLVNKEVGTVIAADQQEFLKVRASCASDANCIGQAYVTRIGELDKVLKDIASRGPY
jgi:uncharacterized protein